MNADTESSVDVARSRAEKLVNEGANILVGAFDSGQSAAIAQVAEQKGVPYVINIAAAPQITEQGYKYVFRNFPTAPMLVRNGLTLMKRSEEHTSELQSLMRISYAVFCLNKNTTNKKQKHKI